MTRTEFLQELEDHNIDKSGIIFDPSPLDEGYCVRKNYYRWEVFWRERGQNYEVLGFPSESDALQHMLHRLIHDRGEKV